VEHDAPDAAGQLVGQEGVRAAQAAVWTEREVVDASGADLVVRTYLEQAEVRRYLSHVSRRTPLDHACDVGAGYGRMSCVLQEFCDQVLAFEKDPALMRTGSNLLPTIQFSHIDSLASLPADDGEFDFSLTYTVLQHLEDELARSAIAEIRRIVRPGGYSLLCEETLDNRDPASARPGPQAGYRPRTLERYKEWMHPFQLVATSPRLAERSYPRANVGSYLLFQAPLERRPRVSPGHQLVERPGRVIHLGIPPRREALKEGLGAAAPLGGAQVVESALLEALLRYRPLDEVCFVPTTAQPAGQLRELLAGYPGGADALVIEPEELARQPGQSVIFQNSTRLHEAAGLRALFGRPDWPAVGLTHSLSGIDGMLAALFGVLPTGLVAPYDRLICTSTVGERAFTVLQQQAAASSGLVREGGTETAGHPAVKTRVIPLGVDTGHFVPGLRPAARVALGLDQRSVLFLYCGRLSVEYKMDPFPLLAAFAAAFRDEPGVSLILAGDTSHGGHRRVPEIAAQLGIGPRVQVVADPSAAVKLSLYQAADAFVSFSDNLQETFGLTIVEAMSCGLPVLASDWSGYRETVAHGETGFLVPTCWRAPDDYSSRFATFAPDYVTHLLFSREVAVDLPAAVAGLRALAAEAGLREALGRRGRARVLRHFAWPAVMAAYGELFADLLDQAAAAPGRAGSAAFPPFGYDRQAVFGQFATAAGPLPPRIARTSDERLFLAAVSQAAPPAADILERTCPPGRDVALETVLDRLGPVLGGRRAAVRVVQLLLKYGAVVAVAHPSE